MNRVGIIDYGMGNLLSVSNALSYIGADSFISSEPDKLSEATHLILPGVGAFPDAMTNLRSSGLDEFIVSEAKSKPLLGICLGMQLLTDRSFEHRETEGLHLIPGEVVRLTAYEKNKTYKIPHMGWNELIVDRDNPLTVGVEAGANVYFVHSFMARVASENLLAHSEYGENVTAIIGRGNVYGCQFHPEKSQSAGLRILKNFLSISKQEKEI